jgi:hypothetical protein
MPNNSKTRRSQRAPKACDVVLANRARDETYARVVEPLNRGSFKVEMLFGDRGSFRRAELAHRSTWLMVSDIVRCSPSADGDFVIQQKYSSREVALLVKEGQIPQEFIFKSFGTTPMDVDGVVRRFVFVSAGMMTPQQGRVASSGDDEALIDSGIDDDDATWSPWAPRPHECLVTSSSNESEDENDDEDDE